MVCVFKGKINPQSNLPSEVKEVAGFKKQAELDPDKCRRERRTSYSLNFEGLSYAIMIVLTFLFLLFWFVWVIMRRMLIKL